MGYDFKLTNHEDPCKECGRSDASELRNRYCSWNHSWAFREFLNEQGLRWIYNKPLEDIISPLEDMLECLEQLPYWEYNFENTPTNMYEILRESHGLPSVTKIDGWAPTVGNAHWFAKEILDDSKQALTDGYVNATWHGD